MTLVSSAPGADELTNVTGRSPTSNPPTHFPGASLSNRVIHIATGDVETFHNLVTLTDHIAIVAAAVARHGVDSLGRLSVSVLI